MTLSEYLLQHKCVRPDLRLISENDSARHFQCLTCGLDWIISRSRLKAFAREENRLDTIRKLTEQERLNSRKVFGPYYGGQHHA